MDSIPWVRCASGNVFSCTAAHPDDYDDDEGRSASTDISQIPALALSYSKAMKMLKHIMINL